jgi:hypothetical protein
MLLEDHERRKFVEWLEQNAMSSELLVVQLDKLPHAKVIRQQMAFEAAASKFLAKKLRESETMTIAGSNADA